MANFFLVLKYRFALPRRATMVRTMTEGIVNRFLRSSKAEMLQKNETEIRCPCRRCKLKSLIADPNSGKVRATCSCVVSWMAIGGKVMKMTTKSSMGAEQEMRKGSKTTTASRAGEKTKNPQEMITTVMLYTVIM